MHIHTYIYIYIRCTESEPRACHRRSKSPAVLALPTPNYPFLLRPQQAYANSRQHLGSEKGEVLLKGGRHSAMCFDSR